MIHIITDSSSDISVQQAEKLGVHIIPLSITFGDKTYKEGVEITPEAFYQRLAISKHLPSTSQPSPESFIPLFTEIRDAGDSAVVILLSGKLSGTVQSAMIARQIVDCPDIHIVDSKNVAVGIRLLVDQAVALRESGLTAEALAAQLAEMADRVIFFAMVDTLEYLYKGGRLSRTAKIAGTLLGFKPIIEITDGELKLRGKGRGVKHALEKLLDLLDERAAIVPGTPYYFGYTALEEKCTLLRQMFRERRSVPREIIAPVGCAIGTHAGPGACVVCYLAQK